MATDLASILPQILPAAIAWAEERAAEIAASGSALDEEAVSIARQVGVIHPAAIRVSVVSELPLPSDPMLRQVALATGLLGPQMIGLTLGHSIYVREGHSSVRLLSHECRHVWQYEQAGSIASYLPTYLGQVAEYGYWDAPLEIDARAWEIEG